jgi:hypothetical protein
MKPMRPAGNSNRLAIKSGKMIGKKGRRPIFISAYEGRSGIRYADVWAG